MQKLKLFFILFIVFSGLFYVLDQYKKISPIKPVASVATINVISNAAFTPIDQELRQSSQHFFEQTLLRSRFNGAILVARNGKIIFENYQGLQNVLSGEPIDSSTAFHLASVSKTFTAMAILKLWENAALQLDDPVAKHLQGFPFPLITIRNLLSHRSGLPNYVHFVEKLGWDTQRFITNEDILQLIIDNVSKLKPGRANAYFDYCNTNYALLALIVEKVSQLSFSDYLDTIFFKPLGMSNSFVYDIEMAETVLPSYKFNNRKEPMMFLDAVYGDKNIYSTPRDMMKWDLALSNNQLFSEKTLEEAFKGYSYERRGTRNYGLGWRLVEMPTGKKIIYHNGWWHGNNTVFSRLPADSTAIIVLGNKFNRSIYQAKKIAGIFKGYGIQSDDDE
ncbi:MAG: serine hydrolase domain-containing protein [bacterium]